MALSIRDPETDRLARELAALTGETMTEAIRVALAERLARARRSTRCRRPSRAASRHLGKGPHPAGLNLGDLFALALARARNAALLFVGEDFA